MMAGIYWLASYPKSGNTWLRLLLQSYFAGGAEVDINDIALSGGLVDERAWFDEAIGIAASDLTTPEILAWQPAALRDWAAGLAHPVYLKTHKLGTWLSPGETSGLAEVTQGAVYLVRDPRDVALSLARHLDQSVDAAIRIMGRPDQAMNRSRRRLTRRLPEIWGSWSQNIESWLDLTALRVHLVRYETLRADPQAAFSDILMAFGVLPDPAFIRAAVAATDLDLLRQQERTKGFAEWPHARGFFGEGRMQGWRDRLTPAQVARIEADHGPVMRRLGYLNADY